MKRQHTHSSQHNDSINLATEVSFPGVISSLKSFNRSQLLEISAETQRLLSTECSDLALSVPVEIWKEIFTTVLSSLSKIDSLLGLCAFESMCRRANCVCTAWSLFIPDLARPIFKENVKQSNWVIGLFSNSLTQLSLTLMATNLFLVEEYQS
jgi:hypothetical protein